MAGGLPAPRLPADGAWIRGRAEHAGPDRRGRQRSLRTRYALARRWARRLTATDMGTGASTQTGGAPPNEITASVVASFESCADNRLRQIMQSLVRHLHDFVVDVSLTE